MDVQIRNEGPQRRVETEAEKAIRERTERPHPLSGEGLHDWLKRIGGPLVKVDQLQECRRCGASFSVEAAAFHKCEERRSLESVLINSRGDLIVPRDALRNPKAIDEMIKNEEPGLSADSGGNFHFRPGAFESETEKPLREYLAFIRGRLMDRVPITIDSGAEAGVESWLEDMEKKKVAADDDDKGQTN